MKEPIKLSANCDLLLLAVQDTLDVMGGKWKMKILIVLFYGETHFMELKRRVIGIGRKMLSQELKNLESSGLITRQVMETRPITVNYQLTSYSHSLRSIIEDMGKWGIHHRQKVIHGNNDNVEIDFKR
jgi:DNA-binding HxlR family transcriptional regulator